MGSLRCKLKYKLNDGLKDHLNKLLKTIEGLTEKLDIGLAEEFINGMMKWLLEGLDG